MSAGRKPVLANDAAWQAVLEAAAKLDRWHTLALLLMPGHVHILAAPSNRNASPGDYARWFKRWVRESLSAQWQWQTGVFDHLLRHNESAQEKWLYMRENPVTAGLIRHWRQWPYQMGFDEPE